MVKSKQSCSSQRKCEVYPQVIWVEILYPNGHDGRIFLGTGDNNTHLYQKKRREGQEKYMKYILKPKAIERKSSRKKIKFSKGWLINSTFFQVVDFSFYWLIVVCTLVVTTFYILTFKGKFYIFFNNLDTPCLSAKSKNYVEHINT